MTQLRQLTADHLEGVIREGLAVGEVERAELGEGGREPTHRCISCRRVSKAKHAQVGQSNREGPAMGTLHGGWESTVDSREAGA